MTTPSVIFAKHIVGGEITYRFLSQNGTTNKYEFTMRIYRDCYTRGGAPLDPTANIGIYNITTGRYIEGFGVPLSTDIRIPAPTYPCLVPPDICVQEGLYVWEKELPIIDGTYLILYQRCCRNETITNIVRPGDVGATYTVEITALSQRLKNNSPVFAKFPPTVICANEPLNFDHSATDAEGDQIVYEFCQPLSGGGKFGGNDCTGVIPSPPCWPPAGEVSFLQPEYSYLQPLSGDPIVKINPVTGRITGTPLVIGQFVVGVCAKEYRNGQLLSIIRRDFQFNVAECKPTVRASVSADTVIGNTYFIKACGDKAVAVNNKSLEFANISDFSFNINIAGQVQVFKTWQPIINFPDTGVYSGNLLLNPGTQCADTIYLVFKIAPSVKADFFYSYDTCIAGPIAFRDSSTSLGPLSNWSWNFNDGQVSSLKNPSHLFATPGTKNITLTVSNTLGCTGVLQKSIRWLPVPPLLVIEPSTFNGCSPAKVFFNNLSKPIDSTYTLKWNFGDGGMGSGISPTYTYQNPGLYSVTLDVTSPIGCKTSASFPSWIKVRQGTKADFDFMPKQLTNFANTATFQDKSTFATKWQWFFDTKGYSILQNPTYKFRDTGVYRVKLAVTNQFACTDTIFKLIDVIPQVTYFLPTAFTPNSDGLNDGFRGKGFVEGMRDFDMRIFNRWGEKIFQTDNPLEEWNGQRFNKGEPSPQGVYLCVVTYKTPRGQSEELKTYATLLR